MDANKREWNGVVSAVGDFSMLEQHGIQTVLFQARRSRVISQSAGFSGTLATQPNASSEFAGDFRLHRAEYSLRGGNLTWPGRGCFTFLKLTRS